MIVEELFEKTIFKEIKEYVETNSKYSPLVTKKKPQQSKQFPIVPVKLLPTTNTYGTLNYQDETYTFGIEIDIYSIDKLINDEMISKRTICDEITKVVIDYFKSNYRVTIKTTLDAPNIDTDVHRNNIKITGKIDTRYGLNKLAIYPR